MPTIAFCLLLLGVMTAASGDLSPRTDFQDISAVELSRAIKAARVEALQDRQDIDFCQVDIFWSRQQTLIDDGMPTPKSTTQNREQCTSRPQGTQYARVFEVQAYADSVRVRIASRFGDVGRWETLLFRRSGRHLGFLEARISQLYWYRE